MHDLLDMGASSVKNSRSPNCSWRNCVVGQRRPQIDARQVLGADQSGHCGWHRSNAWRHDLTAFAHPRRRRTQDGDLIAIAMSRYKGRQRAKSVEQDFPHYVDVGVPNGSDASLPLGRARNVRLGIRCNQQLMMKIYKHHELAPPITETSYCTQSRQVHCEPFDIGERAVGQSTFVSGAQGYAGGLACLECFLPAGCT
jgi:hypothetical protein